MAIPATKDKDQLKRLSDKKLLDYFLNHTRYFKDNPADSVYAIRLGSRSLFAADTAELRDKFFEAVKK